MRKILLVEDIKEEANTLMILHGMCAAKFHGAVSIATVNSWEDAVREVKILRPDLILLDLGLPPGSSTDETVDSLREVAPHWPPVFVITGNDAREPELRAKCVGECGAQDFILKKQAHRDPEQWCERIYHIFLRSDYAQP